MSDWNAPQKLIQELRKSGANSDEGFSIADVKHSELAKLADMNASAFSRFFKQSTGRTVSAYINELRIGFACRLLADTDDSILSISQQSGYQNLSNFNRRFQQHRKMTPREYRNRVRIAV